jgi:hypothetical protein
MFEVYKVTRALPFMANAKPWFSISVIAVLIAVVIALFNVVAVVIAVVLDTIPSLLVAVHGRRPGRRGVPRRGGLRCLGQMKRAISLGPRLVEQKLVEGARPPAPMTDAIRRNQTQFEVLKGHRRPSEAIWTQSEAIRGHQSAYASRLVRKPDRLKRFLTVAGTDVSSNCEIEVTGKRDTQT